MARRTHRLRRWLVLPWTIAVFTVMTLGDRACVEPGLWREVTAQYPQDVAVALGFSETTGAAPEEDHLYVMVPSCFLRLMLVRARWSQRDGIEVWQSRRELGWALVLGATVAFVRLLVRMYRREMRQRAAHERHR